MGNNEGQRDTMETLGELRARDAELTREWKWLQDLLYKIARSRAEQQDARMFEMLQHQSLIVGERRVHLRTRMAELAGPTFR